jgi:hypothetical protein
MFRTLLSHPQEAFHKRHLVYYLRIMSVETAIVVGCYHTDGYYIRWGLGSRMPLFTNNSVHEQIFRAKNISDDERFLGLRTRKLATAAS